MDSKHHRKIVTGVIIILLAYVHVLYGVHPKKRENPERALASILNDDGSLNIDLNSSGSYSVRGWTMLTGPDGKPRFVRRNRHAPFSAGPSIVAGDEDWVDKFGLSGVSGNVYALSIDGEGNVYVGGGFTVAGNKPASYIAKWTGSDWESLGSGVNNNVMAIAIYGDNVYVGGLFTTAGGNSANRVAVWDGSNWNALGSGADNGVNRIVYAIEIIDSDIYVGGNFTEAGGSSAIKYIAKWDGVGWSGVGGNINNKVMALTADANGNLYAGGYFTTEGGGCADRVAKWNGGSWSALGLGVNDPGGIVNALDIQNDILFIGGSFGQAGGLSGVNNIAKCDTNGNNWSAVGGGVNGEIKSMAVIGTNVYAGGVFTHAGVSEADYIAEWNGSSWSALDQGLSSTVYVIAGESDIYVGGTFEQAGSVGAIRIAKWTGTNWASLSTNKTYGLNGSVYVITVHGSDVYVGGSFLVAGGVLANNIAKWDGSQWTALGNGVNDIVYDIVVDGSDVYVCGEFEEAGEGNAYHVAKWNGSTWFPVGEGLMRAGKDEYTTVESLALKNGTLYAGGNFLRSGPMPMVCLAKYSGSIWSALGSEMDADNDIVYALAFKGDSLFVGGSFTEAGGDPSIQYLAKCDTNGNGWAGLGSGVNGIVEAISIGGSDMYVGGVFSTAGGNAANNIAKWDGTSWSSLGISGENGVNDEVCDISINGTDIYVVGGFTQAGSVTANHIAKYNESGWSTFGSGLDIYKYAYTIGDGNLYVGGEFLTAGGKPSYCIAHYGAETLSVLAEIKILLEGPYYADGDTMRTDLKRKGYIPTDSPYGDRSATVPIDVVDWVYVQLRTSADGTAVASKSAFLHSDGRIVADDGTTGQISLPAPAGNYFILVDQRNHLKVMSANLVPLNSTTSDLYDFTTATTKYYGGDAKLLETSPSNVYGMYTGDSDGDNQIQNDDKNDVWQEQVGTSGYKGADSDLNGEVQNNDKNDFWQNNVGKGTHVF